MKALALVLTAVVPLACGDDGTPSEGTTGEEEDTSESMTSPTTVNPSTSTTVDPSTTTMDPSTTTMEPTTSGETEPTTTSDTDPTVATESSSSTGATGDCVEVEVSEVAFGGTDGVVSFFESGTLNPALGGADPELFRIEFYNSDTGSFDLASAGLNDNYQTCAQCVRIFEDITETELARQYFQSAGTLEVDATSNLVGGALFATLTDVTLVEVTIDETFLSTPVEDGACVTLTSPTDVQVLPWTCDPLAFGDGAVCDCGCGYPDPDCADATEASCAECNGMGSCAQEEDGCDIIVDDDNTTCDVPAAWTCDVGFWNADDGCDCGCAAWDPDCIDTSADACDFCNLEGSCDDTMMDCPGIITADMNWLCD